MSVDELEMFLGFVVFLLYPVVATSIAIQKRRSGFALGILLSIFIGLGPIVATYFLLTSARNKR